jgi:hypothetical protein
MGAGREALTPTGMAGGLTTVIVGEELFRTVIGSEIVVLTVMGTVFIDPAML